MKDFAAFILTNGRPDKVFTYDLLRKSGYTGRIVIVIDDLDKTKDLYLERYGREVEIFSKEEIAKTFDIGDNFQDRRAIVYARNASFGIAKQLGLKYFIQLDDDYTTFLYRFNNSLDYEPKVCKNLDRVFKALVEFISKTPVASIALAQGGDFIGGESSDLASQIKLKRKCMNSFVCSVERPFEFVGRMNEDVNSYTYSATKGLLLFTTNQVSLDQVQTQSSSGGMTELYLDSGTYVKSFYSVMYQPSSVKVKVLRDRLQGRLHHAVSWVNTAPLVLSEDFKKKAD